MTLCLSCRRSLLSRLHSSLRHSQSQFQLRLQSTTGTASAGPSLDQGPPAISSSSPSTSQPFSTPHLAPASTARAAPPLKKTTPKIPKIQGSIPGGQELKGLGYLKAKPTVLAKEDDEYPEWLWGILDEGKVGGGEKVDLSSMTKRQRLKHDKKQEKLRAQMPKEIPLHEQSKDLTEKGDSAEVSLERRQEVTKSSRVARRKGIREDNFLRSM